MRVRVLFFAQARDLAGVDIDEWVAPDGSTAGKLRIEIARRYPAVSGLLSHSMLAVDRAFVGDDAVLREGCEVAVIPPVSGG
jgi:molybdopterin converting factor subunit 1